MKRLIFLLLMCLPCALSAQFDKEFEHFNQNIEQNYNRFNDSIQKKFAEALRCQWDSFRVMSATPRPLKPEPKHVPVKPDSVIRPSISTPLPQKIDEPETTSTNQSQNPQDSTNSSSILENESKASTEEIYNTLQINFIGNEISASYPKFTVKNPLKTINSHSIADLWEEINRNNYCRSIAKQCVEISQNLNLNDWAICSLVAQIAHNIEQTDENRQTVLTAVILNLIGYDVKIGYDPNSLFFLVHFIQNVYAVPGIDMAGVRYYLYDNTFTPIRNATNIYSYRSSMPISTYGINLGLEQSMKFGKLSSEKKVIWKDNVIDIFYNSNAIDFYKNYPQTELDIYANADVSDEFMQSLEQTFKPMLANKSEFQTVAFLLDYVQNAFEYKTDKEQFDYEKFFFCEECYQYPACDCEDRAILFSYLVRKLTGLKVVLLDYPNHVATAVHFNEPVIGDYVIVDDEQYTVCDPTYFGASIGTSMPEYKKIDASIIILKNF